MSIGLLSCPHFSLFLKRDIKSLVMSRTTFHQKSSKLKYHFLNIERTQTFSSIGFVRTGDWVSKNEEATLDYVNWATVY